MKINVAQQLQEPVGSVRNVTIDEIGDTGFPINGAVKLLRTNRSILVSGRLETAVREVCSRCLDEFDYPTESGTFTIDENNTLDLNEAARQYTLLVRPMKPICGENCAGLCPQCGRNLNNQSCDCAAVNPDSAWAPLKGLFAEKKQKSNIERG
jgi:uncharacterized protein